MKIKKGKLVRAITALKNARKGLTTSAFIAVSVLASGCETQDKIVETYNPPTERVDIEIDNNEISSWRLDGGGLNENGEFYDILKL